MRIVVPTPFASRVEDIGRRWEALSPKLQFVMAVRLAGWLASELPPSERTKALVDGARETLVTSDYQASSVLEYVSRHAQQINQRFASSPPYSDVVSLVAIDGIRAVAEGEYAWSDHVRTLMELVVQQLTAETNDEARRGSLEEVSTEFARSAMLPEMNERLGAVEAMLSVAEVEDRDD